jgi:hypothetical protein
VEYLRDGFAEWYENGRAGLEQGFIIHQRPPGSGRLCLEGHLSGDLRSETSDGRIDFLDEHGARVLRYAELHTWDASGQEVPSVLALDRDRLAILVDDRGARYPLTVDPLMTSPAWTAVGGQADAQFGFSVGTAGDVNGDGFSDVIVGGYLFDGGEIDEGKAYVFHGSPAGLSGSPAWTAESNQAGAQFGYSVGTAGDVQGDGFDEVLVGAHSFDNGQVDEGRAYLYHGSAIGLAAAPAWTTEANQAGAAHGWAVGTAGDVNGDTFADVIVAARRYDNVEADEGRCFVYHGSAGGLAAAPSWTAESNQVNAYFGWSVGTAGDVNGDGFSEVVVGAISFDNGLPNEGRAYVYHGSAAGLLTAPAWTGESNQSSAEYGWSVGTAGDVNGDGYAEVVVSAHHFDTPSNNEGRVYVYQGTAAGLSLGPMWTANGSQLGSNLGTAVGTAGDVNGDGFADVIATASWEDNGQLDEGRAFVYQGSAAGLSASPVWAADGNQIEARFGISAGTAGDVNGDGFSDVIVGASFYDGRDPDEGQTAVFHGSGAGLAATPAATPEGNQGSAAFGRTLGTAGDVNGDGFSDVIIGAPFFDSGQNDEGRVFIYHGSPTGIGVAPAWTIESNQANAQLGSAVASAGDVNGDGYSDVVVGAAEFTNGETAEGRAFVYLGSPGGVGLVPAWTFEGNQAEAFFGYSAGTAGDVNGDGYSDIAVGAYQYDNGQADEGRAYVFHGSPAGLASAPNWIGEPNQAQAQYGISVGTAGDVNADGFSDLIVGAWTYTNGEGAEGGAFVYHGSVTGLGASPVWTAEGDQAFASFGFPVATAGDVNGDGYSDAIVGAWGYESGQTDEGRAFVYHGSAGGLSVLPSWIAESNQMGANFGISVGTAGDVNGDGFSDAVVGARWYANPEFQEGRAFVYHGAPGGLATLPAWTAESNQASSLFGYSSATAGDVNGDGFSDIIVGAMNYSNGQSFEGRAFLYLGNEGDGLHRIARQARTNDTAPIDLLGLSDAETSFRLKVLGRTPAGRGRVRLQWELKPLGTLFDGSGIRSGLVGDTGLPSAVGSTVPLSELAQGLAEGTLHHWRVRIASGSPFFPRSPWLYLPYNAANESDVRTAPGTTGVAVNGAPPPRTLLHPAAPNPFGAETELTYRLPASGHVRLAVYDVTGRQVMQLADRVEEAGLHAARWDGRGPDRRVLPAGVYLARLEFGGRTEVEKLVLAR